MEGSTSSELMPDNSGLGTGLGTSNASSVMGEKQQTWAGSSEEQSSRPPVSNAFRLLQGEVGVEVRDGC